MLIETETTENRVSITGYRPGAIKVMAKEYRCPLLLSAQNLEKYQAVATFDELNAAHLQAIVNDETELLLVGSGEKHAFLPPKEIEDLLIRGIAVESMSTRNACHTFQVLVYENRKIVALLFP